MTQMTPQKALSPQDDLSKENMRLLQRAREFFGVEEFTAETAMQAAKNVRKQLAEQPEDTRLIRQHTVEALMDDLNRLIAELRSEQTSVEQQITRQSQNKKAQTAYLAGGVSCPNR